MCDIDPRDVETWNTKSSSNTGGGGSQPGNGSNPTNPENPGNGNGNGSGGTIDLDPIVGIGPVNVDEESETV